MFYHLSNKCITCRNKVTNIPDYILDIEDALSELDEILTEYELNDHTFHREYTRYCREWRALERVYYKMLKRLLRTP